MPGVVYIPINSEKMCPITHVIDCICCYFLFLMLTILRAAFFIGVFDYSLVFNFLSSLYVLDSNPLSNIQSDSSPIWLFSFGGSFYFMHFHCHILQLFTKEFEFFSESSCLYIYL